MKHHWKHPKTGQKYLDLNYMECSRCYVTHHGLPEDIWASVRDSGCEGGPEEERDTDLPDGLQSWPDLDLVAQTINQIIRYLKAKEGK